MDMADEQRIKKNPPQVTGRLQVGLNKKNIQLPFFWPILQFKFILFLHEYSQIK